MNVYLRNTSAYYPGFQKVSMFSDVLFRQCVCVVLVKSLLMGFIRLFPDLEDFSGNLTCLVFLMPAVILLVGGMPSAGWVWYGGFVVCAGVAMGMAILEQVYAMLLLILPATYCLYRVFRINSRVLEQLGYMEREPFVKEAFFGLISGLIFAVLVYISMSRVAGMTFHLFAPVWYFIRIVDGLLTYGAFLGLLYGMVMRRLLNLRVQIPLIIGANTVLFFLWYLPSMVGREGDVVQMLIGQFSGALMTQLVLGMVFYFCRSTRMVLFSYFLYYLLYMSFIKD